MTVKAAELPLVPTRVYLIDLETPGCENCGQGERWCVFGPDGVALSTMYEYKDDAQWMADRMNDAFELGHSMAINAAAGDA
jgi:hypothetical protein